ncbi:hypothetical protein D2V17_05075 [Aurantiacibacter xanthus]|uniref:Uncharacterized protein n=1 Tax=Aurantiacibacter xanthus TaxID=1784712 RepID=A0A3A1PAJ0_9SPHN|nr:hypothetical protein [Aurantiacibacter xanthus]RIV89993.1 hypothetical protein D2V17_05075 [Aurantiacibacter xanthus]
MASATDIAGPGRFCGYSPIIDLQPGEEITTLDAGIHAGRFRWDGNFGSLEVDGIGWAGRPSGRIERPASAELPARFGERRTNGKYVVALWNGRQGAAYFRSSSRITDAQIEAIDRVRLFQEGEEPEGCDRRSISVWGVD